MKAPDANRQWWLSVALSLCWARDAFENLRKHDVSVNINIFPEAHAICIQCSGKPASPVPLGD